MKTDEDETEDWTRPIRRNITQEEQNIIDKARKCPDTIVSIHLVSRNIGVVVSEGKDVKGDEFTIAQKHPVAVELHCGDEVTLVYFNRSTKRWVVTGRSCFDCYGFTWDKYLRTWILRGVVWYGTLIYLWHEQRQKWVFSSSVGDHSFSAYHCAKYDIRFDDPDFDDSIDTTPQSLERSINSLWPCTSSSDREDIMECLSDGSSQHGDFVSSLRLEDISGFVLTLCKAHGQGNRLVIHINNHVQYQNMLGRMWRDKKWWTNQERSEPEPQEQVGQAA